MQYLQSTQSLKPSLLFLNLSKIIFRTHLLSEVNIFLKIFQGFSPNI